MPLQGVSDPEKKRKIIGAGFIEVFNDYAKTLEGKLGSLPRFLVQVCAQPGSSSSCHWGSPDALEHHRHATITSCHHQQYEANGTRTC